MVVIYLGCQLCSQVVRYLGCKLVVVLIRLSIRWILSQLGCQLCSQYVVSQLGFQLVGLSVRQVVSYSDSLVTHIGQLLIKIGQLLGQVSYSDTLVTQIDQLLRQVCYPSWLNCQVNQIAKLVRLSRQLLKLDFQVSQVSQTSYQSQLDCQVSLVYRLVRKEGLDRLLTQVSQIVRLAVSRYL